MVEVSGDLIIEILRSIQLQLSNLEQGQVEIKEEIRALRGHMNATQADIANLYAGQARIEGRLERIERRLELSDAHV